MLCAFLSQGTRLTPLRGKRCHYFLTACTRQYLMMIMTIVMMLILIIYWSWRGKGSGGRGPGKYLRLLWLFFNFHFSSMFLLTATDQWMPDDERTGLVRKPCKFETKQINPCLCRALAKLHRARASFKPFAIFFGQGDNQNLWYSSFITSCNPVQTILPRPGASTMTDYNQALLMLSEFFLSEGTGLPPSKLYCDSHRHRPCFKKHSNDW